MNNNYERPPSSRQPRNMRPPSRNRNAPDLIPSSKNVNVVNRPTTSQGLPSAKSNTGSRQVADKSFYIGVIRNRINGIVAEISRLTTELDQRKKDSSMNSAIEQEVQSLTDQIMQQESILADFNVLADRIQNKVSAEDMKKALSDITTSNNSLEREVNRLFREKRDLEISVQELDKQTEDLTRGDGISKGYTKELELLESQIKDIRGNAGDLRGKSKEELTLMVKEFTQKSTDIEKQIIDEQKGIQFIQQQMKRYEEAEALLQTPKGQQYLGLLQQEKKMNDFMHNYSSSHDSLKREISQVQKEIIEIVSSSSSDLISIEKLPSVDHYQQLQQDLVYKERLVNEAQATANQLRMDVEKRKKELEQLQTIDKKIIEEEKLLVQQIDEMTKELPAYEDVEKVRTEGELKKQKLTTQREQLKEQAKQLKRLTNQLATTYNEKKTQFHQNEIYIKFASYERELKAIALEKYNYVETLENERRQSNYSMIKRHVLSIVHEINEKL